MNLAMSNSHPKYSEVRNKIIEGSHLAVKKLVAERKKTNGELVILDNGKIRHVRAKDL